jgi:hypothetical protein
MIQSFALFPGFANCRYTITTIQLVAFWGIISDPTIIQAMINFKKMDEKDFVFISKPLSDKEDKAFSEFLKNRKKKPRRTKTARKTKKLQTQ